LGLKIKLQVRKNDFKGAKYDFRPKPQPDKIEPTLHAKNPRSEQRGV
jgi:hypothetical protein